MNKRGQENQIFGLIVLLVIVILSVSLLGIIADTKARATSKLKALNESYSLTSCYTPNGQVNISNPNCNVTVSGMKVADWRHSEGQCAIGEVVVRNGGGSTLISGVDYNLFAQIGVIQFLNTTGTQSSPGNNTYFDYNYCDSGYFTGSADRALADLWVTLGIIVLLIIIAGTAYRGLKK